MPLIIFLGTRSNLKGNHISNVLQLLSHRLKDLRKEEVKKRNLKDYWLLQAMNGASPGFQTFHTHHRVDFVSPPFRSH